MRSRRLVATACVGPDPIETPFGLVVAIVGLKIASKSLDSSGDLAAAGGGLLCSVVAVVGLKIAGF